MAVSAALVDELNRIGGQAESRVAVNTDKFNSMVRDYSANLLPRQLATYHKWLVMQLLRRVVLKTPVDTGRARGNWQVSLGQPAQGTVDRVGGAGAVTRATVEEARQRMKFPQPYAVIYITNNIAYILVLEGGWSQQAPVGMLAVSMEEMHGKDAPR